MVKMTLLKPTILCDLHIEPGQTPTWEVFAGHYGSIHNSNQYHLDYLLGVY